MILFIEFLSTLIIAFISALILIPILRKIAFKFNLVDQPNYRKVHTKPIPLIGGISIVVVSMLTLALSKTFTAQIIEHLPILGASLLLMLTGTIDDKMDIKPSLRIIIQMGCAFAVCSSGIRLTSLYGIFGIQELNITFQYILTIVIITGVVNAYNLMDGIDGLAGGLAVLGFLIMLPLFWFTGQYSFVILLLAILGATLGFLRFNLGNKKIFLGDGGSLFLGFILVLSGIKLLEMETFVDTSIHFSALIAVISVFLIPVLDSLRVYYNRIKNGISPFKADKSHLHHLVLLLGLGHKSTTALIIFFTIALLLLSFILVNLMPLTGAIITSSIVFLMVSGILVIHKNIKEWELRINKIEENNAPK